MHSNVNMHSSTRSLSQGPPQHHKYQEPQLDHNQLMYRTELLAAKKKIADLRNANERLQKDLLKAKHDNKCMKIQQ
jgi:hypothetical protein